jgi:hypothetical protein
MQKILLLLGSLIAGIASITQIWMSIIVFYSDYLCRNQFYYTNTSIGNEMDCINSLNSIHQLHCKCEYFSTVYEYEGTYAIDIWMRVFNDGLVALASIILILLVIAEFFRSYKTIFIICGYDIYELTTFEYYSISGFFALILNPASFNTYIFSARLESCMVIVDALSIGLIFGYSSSSQTSMSDPFILVTLIISCLNGLRCLLNLYRMNNQNYNEKRNKTLNVNVNVQPVSVPTVPPPDYDDEDKVQVQV